MAQGRILRALRKHKTAARLSRLKLTDAIRPLFEVQGLEQRVYLSLYISGSAAFEPGTTSETVYLNAPGINTNSITQVKVTWGDQGSGTTTQTIPANSSFPVSVTNPNGANVPSGDWTITAQALVSGVWQSAGSLSFDKSFGGTSNSGKAVAAPSGVSTGYGVAIQTLKR